MDFYDNSGQLVAVTAEHAPGDPAQVYLVTADGITAGRITRIAAGEWEYIRADGTRGYARSSTTAAEALAELVPA